METLELALSKAFGDMGQDPSDEQVQAEVTKTADNMRRLNPGTKDEVLIQNLQNNMPQFVTAMHKAAPKLGMNQSKLQDMTAQANEQRLIDAKRARNIQAFQPAVRSVGPQRSAEQDKADVEAAFLPSQTLDKNVGAMKDARAADLDAVGKNITNTQEGMKAMTALQEQAVRQQGLDPNSITSKMTVRNLKSALQQAGVGAEMLGRFDGLSAQQAMLLANNLKESMGVGAQRQALEKAIQDTAMVAAQVAGQIVTNTKTQAEARRAGTEADKSALDLKVQQKAVTPYLEGTSAEGGAGSLEGAPREYFDKYSTRNQQDNLQQNSALLNTLTESTSARSDAMQIIDQTLNELQGMNTIGIPWATKRLAIINSALQRVEKNLADLQAKAQAGQSSAAGALAVQQASPGIEKQKDTLRMYLLNTRAALMRQERMAQALSGARANNTLSNFNASGFSGGIRSYIDKDGNMITLTPEDLKKPEAQKFLRESGAAPLTTYQPK